MKKLLLLFLILFCGLIKTNAQTWAPIGAEWHYNVGDGTQPANAEYIHYKVTKDTVKAGKSCKKIEGKWYKYLNAEVENLLPEFSYQSADTVYYFHKNENKFVPVFIFNVKPGDTLTFNYPWLTTNSTYRIIIDSVTSILLDSQKLQQVHYSIFLDDSNFDIINSSYIEKIGSLNSLFDPTSWITTANQHNYIRCYNDKEISIKFLNNLACDYRETTSEISKKPLNKSLKLFPNPATNKIIIENLSDHNYSYEIYNQLSEKIQFGNTYSSGNEIQISHLPKGIYFIKLILNDSFQIAKFIKE